MSKICFNNLIQDFARLYCHTAKQAEGNLFQIQLTKSPHLGLHLGS